jgi:putative N6-adenine-specific DNA methylase
MNTKYIAKTLFGLEEVLAEELRNLGASDIEMHNRAVGFSGDKAMLYKANLWLRTATRILVPIHTTKAQNDEGLYKAALEVDWGHYLALDQTFAIHTSINSTLFNHTLFVSQKVKDAIADQFRRRHGERPNVNVDFPDVSIQVHIFNDQMTFFLDSSGESLHKRGYKVAIFKAPLSECLAAGMILLSGWDQKQPLYDPMCGSGTILTEAALIARNIAPGLYRDDFGFTHWPDFDKPLFLSIQKEARNAERPSDVQIFGSDVSMQALDETRQNLESAELEDAAVLKQVAFEQNPTAPAEGGMMIINPPYGDRIEKDDIIAFYKSIGDTLKRQYSGWQAWVLSANLDALKFVGLRPSRKIPLFNGPLECRFNRFDLYAGSKKGGGEPREVKEEGQV